MQCPNIILQSVKKTNLFAVIAICAGLIAGCTKSYQPDADTLVVALGAQPLTLDPRYATDAAGTRITSLIFNGFVRVGEGFKVVPEAAESWTVSKRTYTFFLRKDLQFHNGRKLEKEDLIFTWDFYRGSSSPFSSSLKVIKSVDISEKDGQFVMTIELNHLSDSFLLAELPGVKILPKREIETSGPDFNQLLIGTGPFKFVGQKLNEIRLKSVSAKIDNLVFKIIRDDFTRYQKMLKGEVDIAQNELPSEKIEEFQKRPDDFQVTMYPGLNMSYVLINFRDPFLKQPGVRQALAQSIDRKQIIQYKLHGLAQEATSILTPSNPYFNAQVHNPELNIEAAASAIQSAGAKGKSFVLKTSNTPSAIDDGRVLANQMQKSGVQIRHESYEWATYYDDIKKGNFQLATMKWVGTVDPSIYQAAFHSKETPPGRNRGAYNNPVVDKLLDQGIEEEVFEKRRKIFNEVQRLVHQDIAIIPLWYDLQVTVARSVVLDYHPIMTSDYWPFTSVSKRR